MRRRKIVIDLNRAFRCGLRFRPRLLGPDHTKIVVGEIVVQRRQCGVRGGVVRIGLDRLFKVLDAFEESRCRLLVPVETASEIELIRLGVLRVRLASRFRSSPVNLNLSASLISAEISSCTARMSVSFRVLLTPEDAVAPCFDQFGTD